MYFMQSQLVRGLFHEVHIHFNLVTQCLTMLGHFSIHVQTTYATPRPISLMWLMLHGLNPPTKRTTRIWPSVLRVKLVLVCLAIPTSKRNHIYRFTYQCGKLNAKSVHVAFLRCLFRLKVFMLGINADIAKNSTLLFVWKRLMTIFVVQVV
jgi:hypothetical protein